MGSPLARWKRRLYTEAVKDTIGRSTADGGMPADGPETVPNVLKAFSPNVTPKVDSIDLGFTVRR